MRAPLVALAVLAVAGGALLWIALGGRREGAGPQPTATPAPVEPLRDEPLDVVRSGEPRADAPPAEPPSRRAAATADAGPSAPLPSATPPPTDVAQLVVVLDENDGAPVSGALVFGGNAPSQRTDDQGRATLRFPQGELEGGVQLETEHDDYLPLTYSLRGMRERVELRLARGAYLLFEVTDVETGRGLEAFVEGTPIDRPSTPQAWAALAEPSRTVADAAGRCELGPYPPDSRWNVAVSCPGYMPLRLTDLAPAARSGSPVAVRMGGGPFVEGRVVTADGAPAHGRMVQVDEADGAQDLLGLWGAFTDADGAFRLAGLPVGRALRVRAGPPGETTAVSGDFTLAGPDAVHHVQLVEERAEEAAAPPAEPPSARPERVLRGVVLDTEGTPVPRVGCRWARAGEGLGGTSRWGGHTDDQGRFEMHGLPRAAVDLLFVTGGVGDRVRATTTVRGVTPEQDDLVVTLPNPGTVTGRVPTDGEVRYTYQALTPSASVEGTLIADAERRFELLLGAGDEPLDLWIESSEGRFWREQLGPLKGGRTVDLGDLAGRNDGTDIELSIVDADGLPIAHATVSLTHDLLGYWWRGDLPVDAEGSVRVADAPPGPAQIDVEAEGFRSVDVTVDELERPPVRRIVLERDEGE
ncbi:MAG: hypothetical protein AAF682_07960 [Planctomycetota bacterium]